MFKKAFSKQRFKGILKRMQINRKTVLVFVISWLLLGFIGRGMMKFNFIETYRSMLKEYAWTDMDEQRQNLLVLTGPGSYLISIFFVALQDEPKWGMIFDFKAKKIPTWEEFQRSKEFQQPKKKHGQYQKKKRIEPKRNNKSGSIIC